MPLVWLSHRVNPLSVALSSCLYRKAIEAVHCTMKCRATALWYIIILLSNNWFSVCQQPLLLMQDCPWASKHLRTLHNTLHVPYWAYVIVQEITTCAHDWNENFISDLYLAYACNNPFNIHCLVSSIFHSKSVYWYWLLVSTRRSHCKNLCHKVLLCLNTSQYPANIWHSTETRLFFFDLSVVNVKSSALSSF